MEMHCSSTNKRHIEQLIEEVKSILEGSNEDDVAENIDQIQRLGMTYLFKESIQKCLNCLAYSSAPTGQYLYETATRFSVLRSNGYNVSADVFHKFLDKRGKFDNALSNDLMGLMRLYEASHYGTHEEYILTEALNFSEQKLKESISTLSIRHQNQVNTILRRPSHWRTEILESWKNIDEKQREGKRVSRFLELAASNLISLQTQYRYDLDEHVKWWRNLGFLDNIVFARDYPMETFFWAAGVIPDARLSFCRLELAKIVVLCCLIDDPYDNYGSVADLDIFTGAVCSWESEAVAELPQAMRQVFHILYDVTSEIARSIHIKHGSFSAFELRSDFVELCKAHMREVKWFRNRYVPCPDEYLKNAVTSSGSYVAGVHAYFLLADAVSKEGLTAIRSHNGLFFLCGKIHRLWNDLGTFKDECVKGDMASLINCLVHQGRVGSDHQIRAHIKNMIKETWKDMNGKALTQTNVPFSIVHVALNAAKTAQSMYEHGDDPAAPSIKDAFRALFPKEFQ